MQSPESKTGLTGTQKTGFVLLCVFGLLAIGLGFLQMRNNIYGPFTIQLANEQAVNIMPMDDATRLQMIDTDHDGLNDWEELNFYNTSPYLPDTDSDGISDKTEIDQGTDPLCAKGETCDLEEKLLKEASGRDQVNTSTILAETITPADIMSGVGASELLQSQDGSDDGGLADLTGIINDPKKIRELLLTTGQITAEQLAKIDDATLLQMAQSIAQENADKINLATSTEKTN